MIERHDGWKEWEEQVIQDSHLDPNLTWAEMIEILMTLTISEAKEEGYPIPKRGTRLKAIELLERLPEYRAEIYPSPDGEIVLDFLDPLDKPMTKRKSVLLFVRDDGSAQSFANLPNVPRTVDHEDIEKLPDEEFRKVLEELQK